LRVDGLTPRGDRRKRDLYRPEQRDESQFLTPDAVKR